MALHCKYSDYPHYHKDGDDLKLWEFQGIWKDILNRIPLTRETQIQEFADKSIEFLNEYIKGQAGNFTSCKHYIRWELADKIKIRQRRYEFSINVNNYIIVNDKSEKEIQVEKDTWLMVHEKTLKDNYILMLEDVKEMYLFYIFKLRRC